MEEKRICAVCGEEVNAENGRFVGEYFICNDCDSDNYTVCYDCGKLILLEEATETAYGYLVCNDCLNEDYTKCYDCDDWCRTDDMFYAESEYVCENCIDRNYYRCNHCGEYVYTDNARWDDDDNVFCENCIDRYGYFYDHTYNIDEYHSSHDNSVFFYGGEDDGKNLFEGMEIEIDDGRYDDRDDCAGEIRDIFSDFITCESDGSLDSGFENITQPATLDYHISIKEKYERLRDTARKYGFTSHNAGTCGLHIHINRSFFGSKEDTATAKILYMVEKFWDELVKFSRRSYSQLDHWAKKYNSDEKPIDIVKKYKNGLSYDRYCAVNLMNRDTIEFRLFRGTLNVNTILATLSLVDTICRFAKKKTNKELQSMRWEELLVNDYLKNYWEIVKNRIPR